MGWGTSRRIEGRGRGEYSGRGEVGALRPELRPEPGERYRGLPRGRFVAPLPAHGLTPVREADPSLLDRIVIDPGVHGGKPVIRGLRIAVEHVLGWLERGATGSEILDAFPDLEPDDVRACLAYAHRLVRNERIFPPPRLG